MRRIGMVLALLALGSIRAGAEWYDDMKVKGDVRYRFENIEEEDKPGQQRDRIRMRLGVFPRLGPEVDVGIRISTGEQKGDKESPTSGNASLTDGFSGKGLFLDLAYFNWHPKMLKGLDLVGGKMKNPFIAVGDYIWDGDVTPEGLALNYHVGKKVELLVNGGYFWVQERKEKPEDDTMMYGGQAALRFKPNSDTYIMAGVSTYLFDNMEGFDVIDWSGAKKTYGNSKKDKVNADGSTNSVYATEFTEVEGFTKVGFKAGIPVTLFASYVVNTEADENETGYMAGLTLGKASDPKTFELGYNYRYLEKDAAVGALVDSDSWGGGTDGKGHKISVKYQIAKNWQAAVSYFIDQKKIEKSTDYDRLQVDLAAKF